MISNPEDNNSLEALSYWRANHVSSLDEGYKIALEYAKKIDSKPILAKRLKRAQSIINKLRLLENKVQLTTMNDIAGCRVIVSNQKRVYKLVNLLHKKSDYSIRVDYIKKPRSSGYRSIHLIGKFPNHDGVNRPVELQVRTKVQHSWATAVEIVDLFTKQSIKSNTGDKDWSDLFKYTSELFSIFEENPYLHTSKTENIYENFLQYYQQNKTEYIEFCAYKVFSLSKKLDVLNRFGIFAQSLIVTTEHIQKIPENGYILITIDMVEDNKFNINSEFFHKDDFDNAKLKYIQTEKNVLLHTHYVTALVSTNAIGGVKEAYPNYFADSSKFLEYLHIVNIVYNKTTPSLFHTLNRLKYFNKEVKEEK